MPQSPEGAEVKPNDKALEHKAERVGVVMHATVRLGEIQLIEHGTPPMDIDNFESSEKGVLRVVNRSIVIDPDRMDEN